MIERQLNNYNSYIHEPNNTKLDHIPGDYGLPLIGHTIAIFKDPVQWAQQAYKNYGPVLKTSHLGIKFVIPLGPDLAQQVLTDPEQNFSSKAGYAARLERIFGTSVITQDFADHRFHRRIMQTAFKVESLKGYISSINKVYDEALHNWELDQGKTISGFHYIKDLLLCVAVNVFFGESSKSNQVSKLSNAFIDTLSGTLYAIPYPLPGSAMARGFRGRKVLDDYLRPLIPARRAGATEDMFSHLCRERDEQGNYFPDDDIVSQMIFLMFAAHDTTTATLTNAFYFLSQNPHIKQQLYQQSKALNKENIDYDDLDKLELIEQVFYEVLRMLPAVAATPRRNLREVEMGGYAIPPHTQFMVIHGFNHFLEDYWTDPFKFDPARFSSERAEHKKHPFLYHPFGGGAHKCIGMHFSLIEFKCFLHKFILKYDFEARHKKLPGMIKFPIPKVRDNMQMELILR